MTLVGVLASLLVMQANSDATTTVVTVPPPVSAKTICGDSNQNPAYGVFDLFVVFHMQEFVDGEPVPAPRGTPRLVKLTCGMRYGANVDTHHVCRGAYLLLDGLLNGRPLNLGDLDPIEKSWNNEEYRVVERTGSL